MCAGASSGREYRRMARRARRRGLAGEAESGRKKATMSLSLGDYAPVAAGRSERLS